MTRICYGKSHMKMPIGKSCCGMSCYRRISYRVLLCSKNVFHVCPQEFRGSNTSANSETSYTADAQSINQIALQSWPVHLLNDIAVTDKLFLDWMTFQLQTVHELTNAAIISDFMDWMTLQSQTEFMDWMMLWSQTDCSWIELWHCSHKQIVHGLNDTGDTNRLLMNWMMTL